MIIDAVSDLHGHYPKLDGGDLLIVAGDLTADDSVASCKSFFDWLQQQNYRKIIYIAGNHDNLLKSACNSIEAAFISEFHGRCEYLCDSGTEFEYEEIVNYDPSKGPCPMMAKLEIRKLKIWGSPWTLRFPGMNPSCMAFTCETEQKLAEKWALIPDDTDILVTHSPPYQILDKNVQGQACGSDSLREKIQKLKLKAHIFGHIHESYGTRSDINPLWCSPHSLFINASHVNERYEPVNKPIRIEL